MTFRYRWFGIVCSIEDLANDTRRQGHTEVNLALRDCRDQGWYTHCELYLEVGTNESLLSRHYPSVMQLGAGGISRLQAHAKAFIHASQVVPIMEKKGLTASVNGKPLEQSIQEYEAQARPSLDLFESFEPLQ